MSILGICRRRALMMNFERSAGVKHSGSRNNYPPPFAVTANAAPATPFLIPCTATWTTGASASFTITAVLQFAPATPFLHPCSATWTTGASVSFTITAVLQFATPTPTYLLSFLLSRLRTMLVRNAAVIARWVYIYLLTDRYLLTYFFLAFN